MKETKKNEQELQSKNHQENISERTSLPEVLKVRSRNGGYVAWPENTFSNQDQLEKMPLYFFIR
ncbi:MAG TPA: hypothetical protein VM935_09900 [Chitinophagaceae bacterium]|nr:hypothetical protein [Chitinophagaceae bacterium]